MSNITIEMLKERFPVKDVAPYGSCIVVPGDKFNPDWEDQLCAQNHKIFMTSLDDKAVTLVKLEEGKKDPAANLQSRDWSKDDVEMLLKRMRELPGTIGQKCVQLAKEFKDRSPAAIHQKYVKLQRGLKKQARLHRVLKGKDTPLGPRWTEDEYQKLVKLWNEDKKVREIAAEFPSRSGHAVGAALARLKDSGAIKPRWTQEKPPTPPTPSGEKKSPKEPMPQAPMINTTLTIQLNVNCNDGKAVANFLKIIEKMRLRK